MFVVSFDNSICANILWLWLVYLAKKEKRVCYDDDDNNVLVDLSIVFCDNDNGNLRQQQRSNTTSIMRPLLQWSRQEHSLQCLLVLPDRRRFAVPTAVLCNTGFIYHGRHIFACHDERGPFGVRWTNVASFSSTRESTTIQGTVALSQSPGIRQTRPKARQQQQHTTWPGT